jgi:primary-amine oxidase
VADGRAARYWKITNPGLRNATGEPVADKLAPRDSVLPFGQPGTHLMRRAQFATGHLWVTARLRPAARGSPPPPGLSNLAR